MTGVGIGGACSSGVTEIGVGVSVEAVVGVGGSVGAGDEVGVNIGVEI